MKIIYNKWFPFNGYSTINLFGIIITKEKKPINRITLNHELIHTAQMKEMLYIFFYLWYGVEYIIVRFFHKKQVDAYRDVSFEEEAVKNEDNLDYLTNRKHYSWFKFTKINKL